MSVSALGVLLAVLLLVALTVGPLLILLAHRLDRLHLRTEAAWTALDAALARRAVVARTVAATTTVDGSLAVAADGAERASRADREVAENALTRLLTAVDRASLLSADLADELADAEHRVVLARRVHNDVVRDTLALRRRRTVRWLHLAGTAKQPEYFEIAEPEVSVGAGSLRRSARVLLVDERDRVLLCRGFDPAEPDRRFWFAPGGGVRDGEELACAAVRGLAAVTALVVAEDALRGPVWHRTGDVARGGTPPAGDEWFFLLRVTGAEVDTSGAERSEGEPIDRHAWWGVEELASTSDTVSPGQLAELLQGLLADGDGSPRAIR